MTPQPSQIFAPEALAGRVVLVTGGGTNLGKQAAIELAAAGAQVVIAGRREEVLAEAAAEIGERCSYVAGDIREPADATRIVDAARQRHGRLDVLVNNAGGQYFVPAEEIAAKGWRAVRRLNVDGTYTMTRAAVGRRVRRRRRDGRQRHRLPAPRHAGDGAHRSRARGGRGS